MITFIFSFAKVLALLLPAALLISCGGGSIDAPAMETATLAQPLAVGSLVVGNQEVPVVIGLSKVSERRVSRVVYEYVFRITVQNGPTALTGTTAQLDSAGTGTTVVQGIVNVGDLPAWSTKTPYETITIRQDRTLAFNQADLNWSITGTANGIGNPPGPFVLQSPNPLTVNPVLGLGAVSQVVSSSAGGTLSTTGADGTQFTLVIPPSALPTDIQITMTPISAVPDLPFSGGFVAGVHLEPSGLELLREASLTIVPPSIPTSGMPIAFGYQNSGEQLHLKSTPYGIDSIALSVFHFSGYGIGSGTIQDVIKLLNLAPASSIEQLEQQVAQMLAQDRAAQVAGTTLGFDLSLEIVKLYSSFENTILIPEISAALVSEDVEFVYHTIRDILFFERSYELLGHYSNIADLYLQPLAIQLVNVGARTYYAACAQNHDFSAIREIFRVARSALLLGVSYSDPSVEAAFASVDKCLTFKLTIDIAYNESDLSANATGYVLLHTKGGQYDAMHPLPSSSPIPSNDIGYIRITDCVVRRVVNYADCSGTPVPQYPYPCCYSAVQSILAGGFQLIGVGPNGYTNKAFGGAIIRFDPVDFYSSNSADIFLSNPTDPLYPPSTVGTIGDYLELTCARQLGFSDSNLFPTVNLTPVGVDGSARLMSYNTTCGFPTSNGVNRSVSVTFSLDHAPGL